MTFNLRTIATIKRLLGQHPFAWAWVGLIILSIIGCQSGVTTNPQFSPSSGQIILGTTARIRTLDPADAYEIFSGTVLYNLGDRLYIADPETGNLVPQLAMTMPVISNDGLTYTIPLRQGVVFHNGSSFDANAMVFSLQRFISNEGSPSFLLGDVVKSIVATGDYELTITLKQPFAAFPSLLTVPGMCAVAPNVYKIGAGQFNPDSFVGTGPYQLVQSSPDSLKMERFEQYWGERAANPGVSIQFFTSGANLFNGFRSGSVDVAYQTLDVDQILALQRDGQSRGWQMIEGPGNGIHYLSLNLQQPPLDNPLVRKAIAALIDRPLLQDRVFRGQVEPLYSLIPSTITGSRPVFQSPYGDGNAQKAKAWLLEAGYSSANPLRVELWYRSNLTNNVIAAQTLQASIHQKLGDLITLELQGVESATAYQNLDKGVYPMIMLDWSPDFLDADNYLQPFLDCGQGKAPNQCESGASKLQGSFYFSDRANQLISQSRQTNNESMRLNLLNQLQTLVAEDIPFIPLWQNKEFLFIQDRIEGGKLGKTQKLNFGRLKKQL